MEVFMMSPKFPDLTASNYGNIMDCYGNPIKQHERGDGHMYIRRIMFGRIRYIRVEKIVATIFIGNPNRFVLVGHRDHDFKNNIKSNLYWTRAIMPFPPIVYYDLSNVKNIHQSPNGNFVSIGRKYNGKRISKTFTTFGAAELWKKFVH